MSSTILVFRTPEIDPTMSGKTLLEGFNDLCDLLAEKIEEAVRSIDPDAVALGPGFQYNEAHLAYVYFAYRVNPETATMLSLTRDIDFAAMTEQQYEEFKGGEISY